MPSEFIVVVGIVLPDSMPIRRVPKEWLVLDLISWAHEISDSMFSAAKAAEAEGDWLGAVKHEDEVTKFDRWFDDLSQPIIGFPALRKRHEFFEPLVSADTINDYINLLLQRGESPEDPAVMEKITTLILPGELLVISTDRLIAECTGPDFDGELVSLEQIQNRYMRELVNIAESRLSEFEC